MKIPLHVLQINLVITMISCYGSQTSNADAVAGITSDIGFFEDDLDSLPRNDAVVALPNQRDAASATIPARADKTKAPIP